MEDKYYTGQCKFSVYNYTEKCIKFVLLIDGKEINFEWPYTIFTFKQNQDVDVEMKKLSDLMINKYIKVLVKHSEINSEKS